MSKIYEVEKGLADTSHVNAREYKQLYKESIENPICSGRNKQLHS